MIFFFCVAFWGAGAVDEDEHFDVVPSVVPSMMPSGPTMVPTMGPTRQSDRESLIKTAVEWAEIESTLEINGLLCLVLFGLFAWKRGKWGRVYSPRELFFRKTFSEKLPRENEKKGLFGWLFFATSVPDDEMRRMIGLDAFLLLRFCRGMKRIFFWATFFGCVVLLPIYATGLKKKSGFYKLTMANLKKGQVRLWAPVVFTYALTFLVLRFLEKEARNYLKWRRDYLSFYGAATPDEYQSRCSVLVERLPPVLRSDTALKAFFERLVGEEKVFSAVVFLDLRDLEHKLKARDRAVETLKRVIVTGQTEMTLWRCKKMWRCGFKRRELDENCLGNLAPFRKRKGCCSTTVDALEYASAHLELLDRNFVRARDRALADERRISDRDKALSRRRLLFGLRRDDDDDNGEVTHQKWDFFFDHSPFEWLAYETPPLEENSSSPREPLLLENGGPDGDGEDDDDDDEKHKEPPTSPSATFNVECKTGARILYDKTKEVSQAALQATTTTTQNLWRQAGDFTESTIGGLATTLALDDRLMTRYYQRASSGVVTFSSPAVASDVAQLALTSEPMGISAKAVPPPGNMVWQNVGVSADAYETRSMLSDAGLWVLAAFWSTLIIIIQAISNLDEMAMIFPFIKPFVEEDKYEYPRSLVTGYLPVIVYVTLLALVPIFLEYVAENYVGLHSDTAIQRYVLSRHFYFQLVSLLATTLGGSVVTTLKSFLANPETLLNILGVNIPTLASYFMQTLCVKALFSLAWELSRPLPYFFNSAKGKIDRFIIRKKKKNNKSPGRSPDGKKDDEDDELDAADYERPPTPPEFRIGYTGPEFLMVVLVGLTYAPIAPMILVIAFVYFAMAEAVFSRQFLFVYANLSESGGINVFPALSFFTVVSLLVAQAVLFSYELLLSGSNQAPTILVLPFLTLWFYLRLVRFYENPAKYLDRDTAVTHDLYKRNPDAPLRVDAYRHPALVATSVNANLLRARLQGHQHHDDLEEGSPAALSTQPATTTTTNNPLAGATTTSLPRGSSATSSKVAEHGDLLSEEESTSDEKKV